MIILSISQTDHQESFSLPYPHRVLTAVAVLTLAALIFVGVRKRAIATLSDTRHRPAGHRYPRPNAGAYSRESSGTHSRSCAEAGTYP